jgi:cell division inhibitor SepF
MEMSLLNKVMSVLGLTEEEVQNQERGNDMIDELEPHQVGTRKGATVVNLHTQKQIKVVLCEAKTFDEAQTIADQLRSRRPVVVNLQGAPYETALRILDFISGTIYALSGRMEKLGQHVFLCAPDNIEIQGTISEWMQTHQVDEEIPKQSGR